jgi:hypothetical protein
MLSILDAATVVVITGALLYYEGWLFMWLLRRQYAAHASDIDSPRELFLVIGAWSLNWYPFYILAIVGGTVLYLSDILTSGSMAAVPVMTFVAILPSSCISSRYRLENAVRHSGLWGVSV